MDTERFNHLATSLSRRKLFGATAVVAIAKVFGSTPDLDAKNKKKGNGKKAHARKGKGGVNAQTGCGRPIDSCIEVNNSAEGCSGNCCSNDDGASANQCRPGGDGGRCKTDKDCKSGLACVNDPQNTYPGYGKICRNGGGNTPPPSNCKPTGAHVTNSGECCSNDDGGKNVCQPGGKFGRCMTDADCNSSELFCDKQHPEGYSPPFGACQNQPSPGPGPDPTPGTCPPDYTGNAQSPCNSTNCPCINKSSCVDGRCCKAKKEHCKVSADCCTGKCVSKLPGGHKRCK
jgi:hypothetical protein